MPKKPEFNAANVIQIDVDRRLRTHTKITKHANDT